MFSVSAGYPPTHPRLKRIPGFPNHWTGSNPTQVGFEQPQNRAQRVWRFCPTAPSSRRCVALIPA